MCVCVCRSDREEERGLREEGNRGEGEDGEITTGGDPGGSEQGYWCTQRGVGQ